jgi:hypothetical protein
VVADDELDNEVEAIASTLARFDRDAIARTKSYVDQVTPRADREFPPSSADFFELLGRPAQRARSARLEALGLGPTAISSGPSVGAWSSRFPTPELRPGGATATASSPVAGFGERHG